MKVLLDSCVWGGARAALVAAGHDVVWAGEWASDPGDDEILAAAHAEDRVLVTLSTRTLASSRSCMAERTQESCALVGFSAGQQGPACAKVLAEHGAELQRGAIITAEPRRLRIREP